MAYDDGRVACTDREIVIRHYYFPAGSRRIALTEIREARQVPLGILGRVRIHGSGDLRHWFNFDPRRPAKTVALVLFTGARVRPVITPDDPGQLVTELAAQGVNVTGGRERGLL